jgi:hypothetical protein
MDLIAERCEYDVSSLAKSIELFKSTFYEVTKGRGSTAASMSLDALKHYLATHAGYEKVSYETKTNVFREWFPMLEGLPQKLTKACYHGGICTINQLIAGEVLYNIQMVDINSSYPFAMTYPLPYGEPRQIKSFQNSGYQEYVVYIEFKHKIQPFQRCHSENRAREILNLEPKPDEEIYTKSQFPATFKGYLCINSIDLDVLKRNANVTKLEFKQGIEYSTTLVIKEFIETMYALRLETNDDVMREAIKLLLNSLYGKFAQDLTGICYHYSDLDNYDKVLAVDNETLYKPLAGAVTAYARMNLVDTMAILGKDFLYCDTDSLYFSNPERNMTRLEKANKLHKTRLGAWGEEYKTIHKAKFLSKKNYLMNATKWDKKEQKFKTKDKVTCVGLSWRYHKQVTFDNFVLKSEPFEIDKMVNVYGGQAMRKTLFKIKERHI